MRDSKLIQLIKSFSKVEFRRFKKFLQSPFFNSNLQILKFYELLYKHFPDLDSPKLDKKPVFKKLFPKEAYSDVKMRLLISDMKLLVEEYLVQLRLKNHSEDRKKLLISSYSKRNLFNFFEKASQELLEQNNDSPSKVAASYLTNWQLEKDLHFHPLKSKGTTSNIHLQSIMDNLDRFYILSKMGLASEMENRKKIYSEEYDIRFLEICFGEEVDQFAEENPLFSIYLQILQLYQSTNEDQSFYQLKDNFWTNVERIKQEERVLILQQLTNYAIRKVNLGNNDFYPELFSLYKKGLSFEAYLDGGKMSQGSYSNIIITACKSKEFDWAEHFINNHEKYLNDLIKEDAKVIGMSTLLFEKGEFDACIEILNNHSFKNLLPRIKARRSLIKCWYEKFERDDTYYELLDANLDSFEKFIRRDVDMSSLKIEGYLNFIKICKRIMNSKIQQKDNTKIINKIKTIKKINSRKWLLEKIR